MSLSILVALNGEPTRNQLWGWVERWWAAHAPDAEVVVGLNHDTPFNKSRAYNEAAKRASGSTLLLTDCDTYLPQLHGMREVFEEMPQPFWVRPATVERIGRQSSARILQSPPESPVTEVRLENPAYPNRGMFCLLPAEAYRLVDGLDERFAGWGNEDIALKAALDTLFAPVTVHEPGTVRHLWHPRPKPRRWEGQRLGDNARRDRLTRWYRGAAGDPEAMRRVIADVSRPRVFA